MLVGGRIVRIEILPALRVPEEIAVEEHEQQQHETEHELGDAAAACEPGGQSSERP